MSSVGSSDSSNRDDSVRRNREEYQTQLSEQTKKHQKELRRVNEQHYAELEKLKADHEAQMKSMSGDSRDALSAKDFKYQQDMEDLRSMHRKQVQTLADEAARKEDRSQQAQESSSERRERTVGDRFEKLNHDYEKQLRGQEQMFQTGLKEARESQARSIEENRKNQEAYHQREVGALKAERDESVGHLQKQYRDYREDAEGRLKAQQIHHMQENQRASNNLIRAVQKERGLRVESEDILRDGFADGLRDTRERFETARQKDRVERDAALNGMKESAVERVEGQVQRLEHDKENLKEGKVRNELHLKQAQARELKNLREAFSKNLDNLADQRDEAVRQSNERNREDVQNIRGEMSRQLTDTNRFYREKMEENNRINREAFGTIKEDFTDRNEQTKNVADQRVQRIYEETQQERVRMLEKEADNHTTHQQTKHEEIKRIREAMDTDRNAAVRRVQEQMRKQEIQHSERMSNAVNKYEKQITMLKDQLVRERKAAEENLKRTVEGLQHAHQTAVDQLDAKNRDQMRQSETAHSEQLRSLSKRHEEKLDQVITEMKKT